MDAVGALEQVVVLGRRVSRKTDALAAKASEVRLSEDAVGPQQRAGLTRRIRSILKDEVTATELLRHSQRPISEADFASHFGYGGVEAVRDLLATQLRRDGVRTPAFAERLDHLRGMNTAGREIEKRLLLEARVQREVVQLQKVARASIESAP